MMPRRAEKSRRSLFLKGLWDKFPIGREHVDVRGSLRVPLAIRSLEPRCVMAADLPGIVWDDLNAAPVLVNNTGVTANAGVLVLTSAHLSATDADNSASELKYTLTSVPTNGLLRLDGSNLTVGSSFTQQDVLDGKVSYVYTTGSFNDGFSFTLTDGRNVSSPVLATVTVSSVLGNGHSTEPSISADGRYVAFASNASNLVAGDTNGKKDVFVVDTQTGEITLVSRGLGGMPTAFDADLPSISADGRFVTYQSAAGNLVAGDTNNTTDVFVFDRQDGTTTRVSVGVGGLQANGASVDPAISGDGRYIAYYSLASNLVADDFNGTYDVFRYDRQTGEAILVSVNSSGEQGDSLSYAPSISADGRYIAYQSYASNLVADDFFLTLDVFLFDAQSATVTTRISNAADGGNADAGSGAAVISADGRYVAYTSLASNLVADDVLGVQDVFVFDRQSGLTSRISIGPAGVEGNAASIAPAISADGRYVTFASSANNLVAGDTNAWSDVFVYDRQSNSLRRVSVSAAGVQGNEESIISTVSADGRYIALSSRAGNLVANDGNSAYDIFIYDRDHITAAAAITISNSGPVAATGGPYSVVEQSGFTLNAGASTDPNLAQGDSLRYEWDLNNDGIYEISTSSPITNVDWATLESLNLTLGTAHTIRLRVTDAFEFSATAQTTLTVNADPPPTVVGVYVRGASWSQQYLSALAVGGPHDATFGYKVPTGSAQTAALAWTNVNRISVRFSEDVVVTAGSLLLVGADLDATPMQLQGGFSYAADDETQTYVATWQFSGPLKLNRYVIHLDDSIVAAAGGAKLDGEWDHASDVVSGDGAAGGDFNFRVNLAPGDMNGNGTVNNIDQAQLRAKAGRSLGEASYDPRFDLNGNGTINNIDRALGRAGNGATLATLNEPEFPSGEPLFAAAGGETKVRALLEQEDLAPILAEARRRWEQTGEIAWSDIQFEIVDLGPAYLGMSYSGLIRLDDDGAGLGWFIDPTPSADEEFTPAANGAAQAVAGSPAAGAVDLLTVVMHELGHQLGHADQPPVPGVTTMSESLGTGERRAPEFSPSSSGSLMVPAPLPAQSGVPASSGAGQAAEFVTQLAEPWLLNLASLVLPRSPTGEEFAPVPTRFAAEPPVAMISTSATSAANADPAIEIEQLRTPTDIRGTVGPRADDFAATTSFDAPSSSAFRSRWTRSWAALRNWARA